MTYDPRDTDPLHVEEPTHIYLPWVVDGVAECSIPWCKVPPEMHPTGPSVRIQSKPGVPRAVLVWGFGMVLVGLVILAAALLLRGGAA